MCSPSLRHHTLLPSALLLLALVTWKQSWMSKDQKREWWKKWWKEWKRERQIWKRNPERNPSGWMTMIYPPWCETEPTACIFNIPFANINRLYVTTLTIWKREKKTTVLCVLLLLWRQDLGRRLLWSVKYDANTTVCSSLLSFTVFCCCFRMSRRVFFMSEETQ